MAEFIRLSLTVSKGEAKTLPLVRLAAGEATLWPR